MVSTELLLEKTGSESQSCGLVLQDECQLSLLCHIDEP